MTISVNEVPEKASEINDLTIVVVSYNSAKTIGDCLFSLQKYRTKTIKSEIVVVDNASTDESAELIKNRFPDVTLIENPENIGFGRANNIGMAAAPAEHYYLHNSDAYLQDDILDEVVGMLKENPDIGVAGLPLVFPDLSPQTAAYSYTSPVKWLLQGLKIDQLIKSMLNNPYFRPVLSPLSQLSIAGRYIQTHGPKSDLNAAQKPAAIVPVDWVCGAALILREDVRRDLGGGFDPDFFLYGEDEDLCIEAKRHSWKIVQLPTTPVIHDFGWGKSGKQSPVVARLKADSLRVFVNKHFRRGSPSWWLMRMMLWVKRKRWGV